jgi:RNA polymerase sigma-70 factor (ECF subfamily)
MAIAGSLPVGDRSCETMSRVVNDDPAASANRSTAALDLCALYERTVPEVYGYLLHRCGSVSIAEDLTSETFLAAVDAVRRDRVPHLTAAWLITVARNKLVDHWRRRAREEGKLALASDDDTIDEWDEQLDAIRARDVLAGLGPHHRIALTLRYLDGLPVPEVAAHLDRTVHATEALLVRARIAFRRAYGEEVADA